MPTSSLSFYLLNLKNNLNTFDFENLWIFEHPDNSESVATLYLLLKAKAHRGDPNIKTINCFQKGTGFGCLFGEHPVYGTSHLLQCVLQGKFVQLTCVWKACLVPIQNSSRHILKHRWRGVRRVKRFKRATQTGEQKNALLQWTLVRNHKNGCELPQWFH